MMPARQTVLGLLVGLAWTGSSVPSLAVSCPAEPAKRGSRAASRKDCPPPRKLEPYDPGAVRAGSRPGFIDLGGGTEIRVGGRARFDYDVRR